MVAYHNGLKEYIGTDQDDSYTKQLDSDVPPAILRIILVLEAIKKYDRKRWFHRPPFRLSWLLYHATNRNDLALEEMCQMVNLKSRVGGGFRSIWKTDLELPGRYFVYYHQYIKALLQMAVQAEDMTALIALSRRLHVEDEKLTQRHFMGTEARQALLNYFTSNTVVSDLDITRFCKHVSSCDIEVEKRMIDGNQRSTDLTNLVLSCELKKQRKSRESALDRFIANLYAKLYWAACESLFLSEQKPLPVARANPLSEDKIREKLVVRAIRLTNQIKDVEKENAGRESSNTNSNSEVVKGRMSLGSTPSQKVLL
ncbi:hypothetical protein BC833DRAFT_353331 [Globomyces pollinis-pini]|nr:hypothetical protein BC833DRAFT_353331 [Globomyces pollinis-pini]